MKEEAILNEFNGKKTELSKLIKSWNLIEASSKSDFDTLSQKILSNLYEGQTKVKLKRVIESEFCLTYGLYKTDFDADKLTNEIINWWNG